MSTYTTNKSIEQPAHNADVDSWDVPVNAAWAIIDFALGGSVSLNAAGLSGPQNLTLTQYQPLTLLVSGTPTAAITYVVPAGVGGQWVFVNGTSGGFNVGLASAAGGATIVVPSGANTLISCDGSAAGMRLSVAVPPAAAGSTTQLQYNSGGVLAASPNLVFDGTTLSMTGLSVGGNTILGNGAGSLLTLYGSTAAIPNGLTVGTGNLFVLNQSTSQVGVGTATFTAGNLLTVAGNIKITTGGLVFSDNSQLLSAAALAPSGVTGNVQYNNGSGGFAADSAFTYNAGTHTLASTNVTVSGAFTAGTIAGILANGVTATTQSQNNNSTNVATTAYADSQVGQTVVSQDGAVYTGTTNFTVNDTIPTNTAGTQFLSVSITPKSATSKLYFRVLLNCTVDGFTSVVAALFQDSTANALAVTIQAIGANNASVVIMDYEMTSGTTSATTFKVRAGPTSAVTLTVNGLSGSRLFGGTLISSIIVREVIN